MYWSSTYCASNSEGEVFNEYDIYTEYKIWMYEVQRYKEREREGRGRGREKERERERRGRKRNEAKSTRMEKKQDQVKEKWSVHVWCA